MFIFKGIFVILVVVCVFIGYILFKFWIKFRSFKKKFQNVSDNVRNNNSQNSRIIDTQKRKKIIGDDEGEYVDFTPVDKKKAYLTDRKSCCKIKITIYHTYRIYRTFQKTINFLPNIIIITFR